MKKTYKTVWLRFCSRLPELEERITVVFQKDDEGAEEEALFAHPAYQGLPIWSSWLTTGKEEVITAEEAAAINEQNQHYQEKHLRWLAKQLLHIRATYRKRLEALSRREASLKLFLQQVQASEYTTEDETTYIREMVRKLVNKKLSRISGERMGCNLRLEVCADLLTRYCREFLPQQENTQQEGGVSAEPGQ